jgi:uncharacterized membrane protein YhhN
MKKVFLFSFLTIAILELVGLALLNNTITNFTKPLILLSLIGYYHYSTSEASLPFASALFFCWSGDVILMFQERDQLFFTIGLLCFLIGHVLFILSFRKARHAETDASLLGTQKARFAFPIILTGSGLLTTLYPFLGGLKIPVIFYSLVITLMVLNASFRYGRTSKQSYWLVFGGAFLFMTSDSILALNKFQAPIQNADLYIMSTYMLAQFFIVEGIAQHRYTKK